MVVVLVVAMFLVFQSRFFKGSMKT